MTHDDEIHALRQELAELRSEVAELRHTSRPATGPAPVATAPGPAPVATAPAVSVDVPNDRRAFLRGGALAAGVLAAGTATSVVAAMPAAAADNDTLLIGNLNQGASQTTLVVDNGVPGVIPFGFGVTDTDLSGFPSAALAGRGTGDSVHNGVLGVSSVSEGAGLLGIGQTADAWGVLGTSPGIGVQGESTDGIGVRGFSNSFVGVRALSNGAGPGLHASAGASGIGVRAEGGRAALYLVGSPETPNSSPHVHTAGEIAAQTDGDDVTFWGCVQTGVPGTWRELAGPTSAGSFHLLPTQQRIYDSRAGNAPATGPKTPLTGAGSPRIIDASGFVPLGSTAVMVNLTVVNTSGGGFVALHSSDAPWPGTSSVNWTAAGTVIANGTVVKLSTSLRFAATCAAGASTDLIIDVIGYYG